MCDVADNFGLSSEQVRETEEASCKLDAASPAAKCRFTNLIDLTVSNAVFLYADVAEFR